MGGFDLGEHNVYLEQQTSINKRIDVAIGALIIECKKDLRISSTLRDAEKQLAGYIHDRENSNRQPYNGILTDGEIWYLYRSAGEDVEQVDTFILNQTAKDRDFRFWLGAILATENRIIPDANNVAERLGSHSPSHQLAFAELKTLWSELRDSSHAQLKRRLWAKLLHTALGTQFEDNDDLFVEHTYLVLNANLIGHAVAGYDVRSSELAPASLLSGALFAQAGIYGVGEAGFFDWVLEHSEGERFVRSLARTIGVFDWSHIEHDILKILYESVISPETRKDLGEYYTPDWLAEHMVVETLTEPLTQRVLDPSCGSGTFLFHCARHFLGSAADAGWDQGSAIDKLDEHVFGMDIHPVAVALAQVTYLLAIGKQRLAERTTSIHVPVYLGDSLRWDAEDDSILNEHGSVVVPTNDGYELFSPELRFPATVISNISQFDSLVSTLADRATSQRKRGEVPNIEGVLANFAISEEDRKVVRETFSLFCRLEDEGRDHIWSYFVRNQARPTWLTNRGNRVDVLIGNPPWLSYRFMSGAMQQRFKHQSQARKLWAGAKVATHQDLSAYFVARAVELYLKTGGRFSFVMPRAVTTRQQYKGFRDGQFDNKIGLCSVAFDPTWDLNKVNPHPFPVPCAVVRGSRSESATPMQDDALLFSGQAKARESWAQASASVTISSHTSRAFDLTDKPKSPYANRFKQGATLVPRMLTFVTREKSLPLGQMKGRTAVVSRKTSLDKEPWKSLPALRGSVEDNFLFRTHMGETILPFRPLEPLTTVLPYDGKGWLSSADERLDRYPGLAKWWREAEGIWEASKSAKNKLSLFGQLDYRKKLRDQFPIAPIRVVYAASGNALASALVTDQRAVIEHGLYSASVSSISEGHYLTAILNSGFLTELIQPLQSSGLFGPRHFDMYVWYAPIPLFDKDNELHVSLSKLGERAAHEAATVDVGDRGFQNARKLVRQHLAAVGTAAEIEHLVGKLLKS